jgi:hypothetical protein
MSKSRIVPRCASKASSFLGGKSELVHLGEFDDIAMAMMVHAASRDIMGGVFGASESSNGFIGKNARFTGHAAAAPERGGKRAVCGDACARCQQRATGNVSRRGCRARPSNHY